MFTAIILTIGFIASLTLLCYNFLGRNGTFVIIIFSNLLFLNIAFLNLFFFDLQVYYITYWLLYNINFGFYLNFVSFMFVFLILFITLCVFFFTTSYMFFDIRFPLFFSFLQFFMFFMLLLVSSIDLIQLFVAWEGVGIISSPSTNFWYNRLDSNKGALKALVFNRIGDIGYLLFMIFIFILNRSTDIVLSTYMSEIYWYVLLFLFLAAFGKSAQLFLYAWLPDAMEGPTPVSSLLHSATMVTAGVSLIIRFYDLFFISSSMYLYILIIVGGLTSISTGPCAFVKFDIKKIIAFSTCSQLGLMICALGFGLLNASYFHLYVHAFFKCLLFVSSGIIIHSAFEEQDIRKLSSSFYFIPFFYFFMLIGSLSIIGFFSMSGYYSKEFILTGLVSGILDSKILLFISSIITVLYSIRLFFFCFNITKTTMVSYAFLTNNIKFHIDFFHLCSMVFLSILSIFSGYFFFDSFINYDILYNYNQLYNNISFELSGNSILFLIPLSAFYIFILYIYIFSKSHFTSIVFIRFLSFIYKLLAFELLVPLLFSVLTQTFSFLTYRYILLCYEKLFLDNFFIFSWFQFLSSFYKLFNIENHYFIYQILNFFFTGLIFIVSYVLVPLDVLLLFLSFRYILYLKKN